MYRIPVDVDAFMAGVETPLGFDPVVDFDSGEQRTNREGLKQWKLDVSYRQPPTAQRPRPGKRQVVEIKFSANELPEHKPNSTLHIGGMTVQYWQNTDDKGQARSGITLSAETVTFTPETGRATRTAA